MVFKGEKLTTTILHHIIQFFCEITIAKWLIYTSISFLFDIFCNYLLSFWSAKYCFFVDQWYKGNLYEIKNIIVRNFVWPIYIPFKLVYTIGFFLIFKRYEFDEDFRDSDN